MVIVLYSRLELFLRYNRLRITSFFIDRTYNMPKKLIRRYLPTPTKIRAIFGTGFIGSRLADPNLWHLNRRSAPRAVFWGLLCALLPLPMQSLLAASGAIYWRFNLPIAVSLTFLSNPLTLVPILLLGYFLGSSILGVPMLSIEEIKALLWAAPDIIKGSWEEVGKTPYFKSFGVLIFGLVVEAIIVATWGYILIKLYWHWHIVNSFKQRKKTRPVKNNH